MIVAQQKRPDIPFMHGPGRFQTVWHYADRAELDSSVTKIEGCQLRFLPWAQEVSHRGPIITLIQATSTQHRVAQQLSQVL